MLDSTAQNGVVEGNLLVESAESSNEGENIELTPPEIVAELDRHVISQDAAKRAVAIALRNRWRRMKVAGPMRHEITPKNILMIGPTGVGKTEISRRLAKLSQAPFVKVEASKFTEVGYVGRDVDSIVRDLVENAFQIVKEQERKRVVGEAEKLVEEKLLDLLLPNSAASSSSPIEAAQDGTSEGSSNENGINFKLVNDNDLLEPASKEDLAKKRSLVKTRAKLADLLRAGKLEDRKVDVEITKHGSAQMQILGPQGFAEIEGQIKEMFANMVPKQKESRTMTIGEARKHLLSEAQESLLEGDKIAALAVERAEQTGIVFIDEIDKVCGGGGAQGSGRGPDVSREGVQRDLLPIVEGAIVNTKYGPVRTDHVLFIASGAFHTAKPSDLMPEFQGRFPIRVELGSLGKDDFVRILTEPQNALTAQYTALLATEDVEIEFTPEAVAEIAEMAVEVNARTEDIGARRLHTLVERVMEELSFDAHAYKGKKISIDRQLVQDRLRSLVADRDLSRFIL